jgi:hypothetical protein
MGIKYSVNEHFFETWSPTMAYALGFIYADGTLIDDHSSRGKYVSVTSTDEDVIIKLKAWLNSGHSVVVDDSPYLSGKKRFTLRIGNVYLYKSLLNLGLYPNKSLTVAMPKIPANFLKDFVRGYFDGDGCVHLSLKIGSKGQQIIGKLEVIFTSGSGLFLDQLRAAVHGSFNVRLVNLNLHSNGRTFQTRYSTTDSIKLFTSMYSGEIGNAFFGRKLSVFLRYLTLNPRRVDKSIEKILQCVSSAW